MPTSRSKLARELEARVRSLMERLTTLAKAADSQLVAPMARAQLPGRSIVEAIREAIQDGENVAESATSLGIGDPDVLAKFPILLDHLKQIAELESWTFLREELRPHIENVLRIVHK